MPSRPPVPATVFILSVSSDIGTQLALDYLRRGATVCGTYRSGLPAALAGQERFHAVRCDVSTPACAKTIAGLFRRTGLQWDVFISCVGQLSPIGLFFDSAFEAWAQSVQTNSVAQLRALHAAYPFRHAGQLCHVVLFAGGGTNNPFRAYSAYCLGKIALIKMCELLDDENPDLNPFIVGTGWVQTKIHRQTLAAGTKAGANFATTQKFIAEGKSGTAFQDISALIDWGIAHGKRVSGGRNFSLVHDAWRQGGGRPLAAALRADPAKFKLRRQGNS